MRICALVVILAVVPTTARAGDGDRWDGATMTKQVGGAAVGGAVVGTAGALLGALIGSADKSPHSWAPVILGVFGACIGGSIGIVAGTQYIGDEAGGTGHWWGTTLGYTVGVVSVVALWQFAEKARMPKLFTAATVVILLASPIIGYQLSAEDHVAIAPNVPFLVGRF